MSREHPDLTIEKLQRTLTIFLDLVKRQQLQINYRFCGTAAALLYGVELPANDIDITVKERNDVDAFGSTLSSYKCLFPPTWLPEARQYYANYSIDGVEIGFSTVEVTSNRDTIETYGRGLWEHFYGLPCGKHIVPTVALELRLHTELHRNRQDRYQPIMQFLKEHGCDHDLVRRCIAPPCNLPKSLKRDVREMLKFAPKVAQ